MTVVLPAPVASLSAARMSSGFASLFALARCSRIPFARLPACGATSVSQMIVSTASTWQKNGRRLLNWWCRQCWRRRAVSGVTCHWFGFGGCATSSTSARTSLMIDVGSYCCAWVEIPSPSSVTAPAASALVLRFFGFGIGVTKSARRRLSTIFCVGWPVSSSSQWRAGRS